MRKKSYGPLNAKLKTISGEIYAAVEVIEPDMPNPAVLVQTLNRGEEI